MEHFDTGFAQIADRFARVEPRRQARAYLLGLLADVETRSCWRLAEHAGDQSPHRMQRLLGEAVWDADAVRDDLRGYVADQLGDPAGVLIMDDTGDFKKRRPQCGCPAPLHRHRRPRERSDRSVLGYAARGAYTLIDREIYLPRSWTDRPDQCAAAGVPDHVRLATKISLARRMLAHALAAGIGAAWATADEFYGGDQHLRRDLQIHRVGYALVGTTGAATRTGAGGRHPLVRGDLLPDRQGLGLDEHQVRRRDSWYRHTTLVMLAHAILTVIAAHERAHQRPEEQKLVPLSINEIRRLLAKLAINTAHTIDHWLGWSTWRRRHQARAKTSHYRRRGHFEHRPAPT